MPSILVAYATKHGTTRAVAEVIAGELRARSLSVTLCAVDDVHDLRAFDAVVLGGPLYHGHWHREASRFLMRHRLALEALSLAVFALDPSDGPEREPAHRERACGQLEGALRKAPWLTPVDTQRFGAALDPSRLHSIFNRTPAAEWRDWAASAAGRPPSPPRSASSPSRRRRPRQRRPQQCRRGCWSHAPANAQQPRLDRGSRRPR